MDLRLFVTVFTTVFLAELGDKTQLATLLYASQAQNPKMTVFMGASLALIAAAGLGVLAGALLSDRIPPRSLSWVAGFGFIAIGLWTLLRAH